MSALDLSKKIYTPEQLQKEHGYEVVFNEFTGDVSEVLCKHCEEPTRTTGFARSINEDEQISGYDAPEYYICDCQETS